MADKDKIEYETYALAFLDQHLIRAAAGQVYRWAGDHYEPVPDLKTLLRRWFKANHIRQTNTLVDNTLPIILAVAATDHALPCWDDGRTERLVPFQNGLLRPDGELLPHTPNYLCPWVLPCRYDPAAGCPTWLGFLDECLNHDPQQVALLQEWFGYVLSGDTHRQKYMTHVGAGGSGKSTVANVLRRLCGTGATAFNVRQLAGRFGIGGLVGKSLAVCGEVELAGCRERSEIMETLKSITGNDAIQVERKGDNVFRSVVLPTRFHVLANATPELRDPTLALTRRMLLLRSDKTAAQADTALEEKLVAELAGIAQWALAGYRRLTEAGRFTLTDRQKAEVDHIQREASPAISFLVDRCVVRRTIDPGSIPGLTTTSEPVWAEKDDVWEAVKNWAEANLVDVDNPSWFFRDLHRVLPGLPGRSRRTDVTGRVAPILDGVGLKP